MISTYIFRKLLDIRKSILNPKKYTSKYKFINNVLFEKIYLQTFGLISKLTYDLSKKTANYYGLTIQ